MGDAVDRAIARATAPVADDGDGWETTAAVLAYEVQRLRSINKPKHAARPPHPNTMAGR